MLAEVPSRRVLLGNQQATEILGHGILPDEPDGDYDGYELLTLDRERVKRDDGRLRGGQPREVWRTRTCCTGPGRAG